jgi:hypothetical protein
MTGRFAPTAAPDAALRSNQLDATVVRKVGGPPSVEVV